METDNKLPNFTALIKKHFFAGLLIVIPFGVIGWIIASVLELLWSLHEILPLHWRPENAFQNSFAANFVNLILTLVLALVLALAISIVGWTSRQYVGRKLLEWVGEIIQYIPVIRSIYSALDQLLSTFSAEGGHKFNRVVYVEYPRKGIWALGFVTSPARGLSQSEKFLNVYVPTTPNPTSGFHLIVSESEIKDSHMSVEEAFKTILSLGIAQPTSPKQETR